MKIKFYENDAVKVLRSTEYNYDFNKKSGYFKRWGKTEDDDPIMAPLPEILDFEITEICEGPGGVPCPFCYKANGPNHGSYTPFETAKVVIDKMPWVTQIAFGVDAQCKSNPDTLKIMRYARSKGIVPNVTVADVDGAIAGELAGICGAVSVSRYADKNYCYNSIHELHKNGLKQINMHILISRETLPWIYETLDDAKTDPRLKGLNAIVLLSLKKKGRGAGYNSVTLEEFENVVETAFKNGVSFGFDSCGAHKFESAIQDHPEREKFLEYTEPCESSLFSSYVNVHGEFFPCSFTEGNEGWENGISVLDSEDFIKDVWMNPRVNEFRASLIKNKRHCPIYDV